ncbi:hypothetical protein [Alsobacter sp. R-9]
MKREATTAARRRATLRLAALVLAAGCWGGLLASGPASAQKERDSAAPSKSWPEVKCERYTAFWKLELARSGGTGISAEFISRHDAFLASGCTGRADVCPRTREELDLSNRLTVRAMNMGTASTFLPFVCRS